MVSQVKTSPLGAKPKLKRKTRRQSQIIPQDVRFASILGYIRKHGSTNTKPMAAELGYHAETTRNFANKLVDLNQLHRTTVNTGHGCGEYFYHLGPAPVDASADADDINDDDQFPLVRARPSSWPPCHKRDLLVCAMFSVPAVLMEQRL